MHAPTPPTPRQAPRRHAPAGAALFAVLGLFAAACGGPEENRGSAGAESQEVHLQPVASAGPAPFTASSATGESAPVQPPLPNPTGQGIRTVNAATPGLYGGTERLGSCDVEQQVGYLTADNAKARAFAQASDIEQAKIPEFLRGLTPVVLRADTRVTSHGFRDGRAESFQSVLQAGTAVLVDEHGMPRVRCACGNPLLPPRAPKGSPVHKGEPWNGYQPNQVVVIEPTSQVINNLVIVNIADNTWIERKRGDDGAQDRPPQTAPPYDPADGIPEGPLTPPGTEPADPCPTPDSNSLARTAPPATPDGAATSPPPAADCVPSGQPSPPAPGEPRPQRPGVPPPPALPPQQPPSDVPTDLPPDAPLDAPMDVPSDIPSGVPFDPSQIPGDPALPPPDGPLPLPDDPYGPADPHAVPDQQQPPPSDPGHTRESA
ncbi:DUF6777 domain-containing protein [Streptomyces sp. CB00455]|uniref:DUF6777 domain-containing protein n=1 Tax=Streptomyces sp. CB00455 TaxID=1703927 RepID=UPI000A415B43|nr:DUF6777 domain-containing protein [Streptomyces sp. CB00455]